MLNAVLLTSYTWYTNNILLSNQVAFSSAGYKNRNIIYYITNVWPHVPHSGNNFWRCILSNFISSLPSASKRALQNVTNYPQNGALLYDIKRRAKNSPNCAHKQESGSNDWTGGQFDTFISESQALEGAGPPSPSLSTVPKRMQWWIYVLHHCRIKKTQNP